MTPKPVSCATAGSVFRCPRCTFDNEPAAVSCTMCQGPLIPSSVTNIASPAPVPTTTVENEDTAVAPSPAGSLDSQATIIESDNELTTTALPTLDSEVTYMEHTSTTSERKAAAADPSDDVVAEESTQVYSLSASPTPVVAIESVGSETQSTSTAIATGMPISKGDRQELAAQLRDCGFSEAQCNAALRANPAGTPIGQVLDWILSSQSKASLKREASGMLTRRDSKRAKHSISTPGASGITTSNASGMDIESLLLAKELELQDKFETEMAKARQKMQDELGAQKYVPGEDVAMATNEFTKFELKPTRELKEVVVMRLCTC